MIRIFLSAFSLVFLAELGDKTQLTTMLLASQSRSIWPVILGSSLALVLSSILGAFLGTYIQRFLPPELLRKGAGVAFVFLGFLLWLK